MSALLWRHRGSPRCAAFDATAWWAAHAITWPLPDDAAPGEEPLEQRRCPGGCGSHISAESLEMVVVPRAEQSA